jgi:rhodanese-related sulfurtransferase
VEEAAQHLRYHCHGHQERNAEEDQEESLNEATGVRRRLEPISEETEASGDRSSSSIPQSPSRKALGSLTTNHQDRSIRAVRKPDFGSRPQHWSANRGSLDDELPIPKVRRTMSMSLGGGFFPPNKEERSLPLNEIPSFSSTKDAIPRICTSSVLGLLDGTYAHLYDRLLIIDARYPYEYAGGHLPGAVNLCGLDAAEKYLFSPAMQETDLSRTTVVVFHCEFSSERAPRMALHVRGLDRSINAQRYPHLHFPRLFILEGGYRGFFQAFPQRCEPPGQYLPMRNPRFKDELRFHQRMKQIAKEKVPVSRRLMGTLDSPRLSHFAKVLLPLWEGSG